MKKSLLGLTFASLMFSAGSAVAADYKIDKEGQHAFVNFRIQHLGYSWLYGTFKDFDGTFTFDEKNPAADKVNVQLTPPASILITPNAINIFAVQISSILQNIHWQHSPPPA